MGYETVILDDEEETKSDLITLLDHMFFTLNFMEIFMDAGARSLGFNDFEEVLDWIEQDDRLRNRVDDEKGSLN